MKRYSIIPSFCVLVTLSWCMISCDGFLKESPRDALPEEEGYRNMTREDPVAAREDWMKIRWVKISLII